MTSGAVSINFVGVLVGPLLFTAALALTHRYEAGFVIMAAFVALGATIALFGGTEDRKVNLISR
jgi:hypothetical protein